MASAQDTAGIMMIFCLYCLTFEVVENIFIENIIDFLQFLMLSAEIKVLILESAIKKKF